MKILELLLFNVDDNMIKKIRKKVLQNETENVAQFQAACMYMIQGYARQGDPGVHKIWKLLVLRETGP